MPDMPRLYYDASCGLCRREIEHLRARLEPGVQLINISAADFEPPAGYTLEQLMARIHFFDGQQMLQGYRATLSYWNAASLKRTSAILRLPLLFHCGDFIYNRWANWRIRRGQHCQIPAPQKPGL
ncbi:thiol-disulfide oxidoreductase DCC family protein [Marinospirillum alkaliphilum]|uniref:Predicted thiol-disulfide oxidoreductase YuxK, DCC family n=1 Tax=Marinospirillum alkaliphilum DSM 21637 TaxID=1122209 RepID=A0A1K1X1Q3_9GAMM|nr:DUF393 domain-containing protein [Marinospirillum alkaliphilum]SFX42973.1 Predicted thiol-disulfide oxidoreductase YuxK, DCC family [Marinospirillum alkaliphilum DSM 21637]